MNGDITGVTTEDGDTTGVTTADGEFTEVTTVGSTITGATTEDGGITGVNTETTRVLLNDEEAPTSGTEDHPGTPGVAHEGASAIEPGSNDTDNPPPLGPPTSDDDSDSDDDDDDSAGDNYGIETHHSETTDDEVYHPDTRTPSVQQTYGLKPKRSGDYSHMFSHETVMHHAMTQYSLNKGLRKFKKVGE
jgi:hypothetical protein